MVGSGSIGCHRHPFKMTRVLQFLCCSRSCGFLRRPKNAEWVAPMVCLLLAASAVASVPIVQAGTKSPPASLDTARPLHPTESAETHLWGKVEKVLDATSLVVVTSELTR